MRCSHDSKSKYRQNHKDQISNYNKQYYEVKKSAISDYKKTYYQSRKADLAERNAEYYQQNKEVLQKQKLEAKEKMKGELNHSHLKACCCLTLLTSQSTLESHFDIATPEGWYSVTPKEVASVPEGKRLLKHFTLIELLEVKFICMQSLSRRSCILIFSLSTVSSRSLLRLRGRIERRQESFWFLWSRSSVS